MKMTKELYKKCRNELGQALRCLDKETQYALEELRKIDFVDFMLDVGWSKNASLGSLFPVVVYRVSDSYTFTEERETADLELSEKEDKSTGIVWHVLFGFYDLSMATSFVNFCGIGYELDGEITLRTSVDAAFGTPKFVRVYKED